MWRFILRRLAFFVFTLIFTSLLVFALTRILPEPLGRELMKRQSKRFRKME